MRFQLENLKTARGLNKKAVKSNVPVRPPPSSTSHTPSIAPASRCLGSPSPGATLELAHAPGLQPSGAAVQVSAAECTRWNIHQSTTALCVRKNVFQTAAPLPAALLGRCTNAPCFTCSHQVLVCCVFAKLTNKPINLANTCIHG